MSIFTKVCTGLLISALSLTAQAAQPETEGQGPAQEPAEGAVEVSNAREVIQVLHLGVKSEMQIIDLVKERGTDEELQQFVDQLSRDVTELSAKLSELAASKSVDLAPEQMTENAKIIEAQMAKEFQDLIQKPDGEFRAAVIEALISQHEKALDLYTQVDQISTDAALKAAVAEFRPITQKHLEDLQKIQLGATEPTQPSEPAQPTE